MFRDAVGIQCFWFKWTSAIGILVFYILNYIFMRNCVHMSCEANEKKYCRCSPSKLINTISIYGSKWCNTCNIKEDKNSNDIWHPDW
jgi:hypothetical protein